MLGGLDMTEGRNTGIPTIQNELKSNGSHRAVVTTDEDRTFFRITIPCHEAAGNIISDIAKKDGSPISSLTSSQKSSQKSSQEIIELITQNPKITLSELANMLKMTRRGIDKNIKKLKEQGLIRRVGPDKGGHWEVVAG